MKYTIIILITSLILLVSIVLVGCTTDIVEPCQEFHITYLDNKCEVCGEKPECPTFPGCPTVEGCPVCPEYINTEDEVIILRAEKDYDWALYYIDSANETLKDLKRFVDIKQFDNCSRIITEAIEDIETANGFLSLSIKKFETLPYNIVAMAYKNASARYISFNQDYVQYLIVHRDYCDKYEEGYDDRDLEYMGRYGNKWLNRSMIHWYEYEHFIRLVEELR